MTEESSSAASSDTGKEPLPHEQHFTEAVEHVVRAGGSLLLGVAAFLKHGAEGLEKLAKSGQEPTAKPDAEAAPPSA